MNEQELKAVLKVRRQSLMDTLMRLDVGIQMATDYLRDIDESKLEPEQLYMKYGYWRPTFLSNLNLVNLMNKLTEYQDALVTLTTITNQKKQNS